MGWVNRRPASSFMSSGGIIGASLDCHDLHFTSTSAWHRLNWLLCLITQACEASKHAVFSFGEADMGGAQMGKNAVTCYAKLYGYQAKRLGSELAWSCWFMILGIIMFDDLSIVGMVVWCWAKILTVVICICTIICVRLQYTMYSYSPMRGYHVTLSHDK